MKHTPYQLEMKQRFIRALAEFLGGTNQAEMSIRLEMGQRDAVAWAGLRRATPLHGYPTADEAERILTDFLDGTA